MRFIPNRHVTEEQRRMQAWALHGVLLPFVISVPLISEVCACRASTLCFVFVAFSARGLMGEGLNVIIGAFSLFAVKTFIHGPIQD